MTDRLILEQKLIAAWPPGRRRRVVTVVGVSAGPDSVALLRAMVATQEPEAGDIIVCHVNHQLRGAASEADQQFVQRLCEALAVRCDIHRVDTESLARQQGDGLEAAARTARYAFFAESARTFGARYVATAHTASDQIETVLQRMLRGTSLTGLAGIPARRLLNESTTVVRPLLDVRREEVLEYLAALKQDFREDSSNQELRFTRNRIRHALLPLLREQYNANVDDALLRLARLAGEANAVVNETVETLGEQCVRYDAGGEAVEIDVRRLYGVSDYVAKELFVSIWKMRNWPRQAMGMTQWEQLCKFAKMAESEAPPPAIMLPGSVRAEIFGSALHLTR